MKKPTPKNGATKARRADSPDSATPKRGNPRRLAAAALALATLGSLVAALGIVAWPGTGQPARAPAERWHAVAEYPHDPQAFTQGLAWHDGRLLESTGLKGRSEVRVVELQTGKVLRRTALEPDLFGEGATLFDGRIYQLTWKARRGFVYRADDLAPLGEFAYRTEGWGLTHDGERLVMSDGTNRLRWIDRDTGAVSREVAVSDGARGVGLLNELEWVDGRIWANVWKSDRIAVIAPQTGKVEKWVDLSALAADMRRRHGEARVLNGIAWDAQTGKIMVTGKMWPKVFAIAPAKD